MARHRMVWIESFCFCKRVHTVHGRRPGANED